MRLIFLSLFFALPILNSFAQNLDKKSTQKKETKMNTSNTNMPPVADGKNIPYNKLTPEEEKVIVNKGTEYPGTGEYEHTTTKGVYVCRRCNAPLYRSESKFDAMCGWPAFDDEIKGAVKRIPDPDGMRTEIVCANCGAHLGHVFIGEGFTPTNTRHCVNSVSMKLIPVDSGNGK